jgi:SAM-dependent methyltransferase
MTDSLDGPPARHETNGDDLLWRHLKTVPAFRGLLRSVEARFYRLVDLPSPVLDLGCGDGHFAQMTFSAPLAVGVDPWGGPLRKALGAGAHDHLLQGLGDALPFPDNTFGSAVSNSVLEHIEAVEPVLSELNRVLVPGGPLMITMPSHLFTKWLGGATFLERFGAIGWADIYRRLFNSIARHAHTDAPSVWAARLADGGFAIERWQYYFSQRALWALEWGHLQGLPSALLHAVTGHWIVAPWKSNLARTERWVRPYYEEHPGDYGAYIMILARKIAEARGQAYLPVARPFSKAELVLAAGAPETTLPPDTSPFPEPSTDIPSPHLVEEEAVAQEENAVPVRESEIDVVPKQTSSALSLLLFFTSIASAIVGQIILSQPTVDAQRGLNWYGVAIVALAVLCWRASRQDHPGVVRLRLPQVGAVQRKRWLIFVSLAIVMLAYRSSGPSGGTVRPAAALMLWLIAILVAFFALDRAPVVREPLRRSRFTLAAATLIFSLAFLARFANLAGKPFILSGVESSIGLDALNIADGFAVSPFATGWLTNPTLVYYLLSIPLKLFGPSVLSIRMLSPLVGAATVALLFVLGGAVWGRQVGTIAATLLAGSHFHLHYSRLGATNVWDPFVTLLAVGLVLLAWRRPDQLNRRRIWLASGCAVGLGAYFFTSSRLLPPILISTLLAALILRRGSISGRWQNILAATLMAFVVSLPQLLFYNDNPGTFMDRANALGIGENQSGWVASEAERTNRDQSAILLDQIQRALLSFNHALDNSPSYRPGTPLLSLGPAILFSLGVVFAAFRPRRLRSLSLLIWVAATMTLAGAMLIEVPSSHRLLIATPALSLLGAIGLVELGNLALRLLPERRNPETRFRLAAIQPFLLMVLIAAWFSVSDLLFYYRDYEDKSAFADRNTEIAHRVSQYLNNLDGDWTAYFYGPPSMYIGFPTIPFLTRDFQPGQNLFDVLAPGSELTQAFSENQVHLLLPERADELAAVQARYPDGDLVEFSGSYANPLFLAYEVHHE